MFEKALALTQKMFGDTHPFVATDLTNLATIYSEKRNVERNPFKALAVNEQIEKLLQQSNQALENERLGYPKTMNLDDWFRILNRNRPPHHNYVWQSQFASFSY